ncbi:MAG: hypothetical protein IPG33_10730 [Betaproteobacteria bacterium]|nr:hypothetical protein [Betaproteobacteria bacterium]
MTRFTSAGSWRAWASEGEGHDQEEQESLHRGRHVRSTQDMGIQAWATPDGKEALKARQLLPQGDKHCRPSRGLPVVSPANRQIVAGAAGIRCLARMMQ